MGKHDGKSGKHVKPKIDPRAALDEIKKRDAKIAAQQLKDQALGMIRSSY
jgi:hypothetical protein